MYAWQATVQDEAGNIVPLPVVTVYLNDGTTFASIFNESGSPLPNPLTGTMEGFVQFWAEAGQYKIRGVNGSESTEIWQISLDVPTYTSRAAAAASSAGLNNGSVLFVNGRKFLVDSSGPDGLLAVDYDWSGRFHGQVARAEIGGSVKFACYGDSTTDGNGTTGWTANPTDGSGNAIGTSAHNPPNAWPAIFRDTVREMFGNSSIDVWNAGYGGKDIVTGWAASNFATAVINNASYGTPDVCFINFGLNDIVRPAFTRNEFIKQVNYLLNLMDYYGIIPVFMTPDPVVENTLRQGGNIVKVSEIYRELAGAYGIDVFDSGQALNDVFSSNGTNALWSFQQPDNLHGGNNWHRVKGSFIAAKTFPKTLFLDESITNVASWSKYANTEDLTYNIFDAVSNRFGASMNVVAGSYTAGQPLINIWAWGTRPNVHAMWFSVDGDGYYYPRPLSDAPRVSYYSFLTGNTITSPSQSAGCSVGAAGYRQSEAPMDIGVINCGLSRLQYLAPTDSTSNAVYLGYFSFRDRSRPATSSRLIPSSGSGMAIYDNDPFGRYGQSAGFGIGKTLSLVCDVQMPVGAGFVLFSQRVFGNASARVDQDKVSLILYRGAANISIYQVSTISGVTSLIGGPLVTAAYTWKSGKNEFAFEMTSGSAGQSIEVFQPDSSTPLMSVVRPLSNSPILSGGDVGGFFYNHASGSGGLASAIIYDIN